MMELEDIFAKGNPGALYEALRVCINDEYVHGNDPYVDGSVALPRWVVQGVKTYLHDYILNHLTTGQGRNAKWSKRYAQDMIDYWRYDMVCDARLFQVRWDEVYTRVAKELEGEREWGSPDTIKKSYLKVKRGLRSSPHRYEHFKYIVLDRKQGKK